jgi:hypothetical protein
MARLATIPVVCRSASLNITLIVGQIRIAASKKAAGLPSLPSCGASLFLFLSSQINSEPRLRSKAVSLDPVVMRYRTGSGLRMPPVQPYGFTTRVLHRARFAATPIRFGTRTRHPQH